MQNDICHCNLSPRKAESCWSTLWHISLGVNIIQTWIISECSYGCEKGLSADPELFKTIFPGIRCSFVPHPKWIIPILSWFYFLTASHGRLIRPEKIRLSGVQGKPSTVDCPLCTVYLNTSSCIEPQCGGVMIWKLQRLKILIKGMVFLGGELIHPTFSGHFVAVERSHFLLL